MSDHWIRIGKQPGAGSIPEVEAAYYLSYRAANGREELAYRWNKQAGTWETVNATHIAIGASTITIDGTVALRGQGGLLTVSWLSEKGVAVEPSAVFYMRTSRNPAALAVLTKSGKLGATAIREAAALPIGVESFRLFGVAVINQQGLTALSLKEGL